MVSYDSDDTHERSDSHEGSDSREADESSDAAEPQNADHYRHGDGTDEIVFAVDAGHVLTVREYSSVENFQQAVTDAEYVGQHEEVADLPGVAEFEDSAKE